MSGGGHRYHVLGQGIAALRAVVTPPPGAGYLAGSALADALGTGLFLAGAVIFFSRRLGLSAAAISGGFVVAGAVGLALVAPLGVLTDRFGYALSLRTVHFARAVVFPLYLVARGPIGFTVITILVTIGDRLAAPAFQAVTGTVVGDDRYSDTMGYIRALRNAGFSLGALLTSLLIVVGTSAAYDALVIGNAVSFLLAGALLRAKNVRAPGTHQGGQRLRGVRPRYLALSGLNVVLQMHDAILLFALPLYVIKQTGVPVSVLPLLVALNTVLVVLSQRWLSNHAATLAGAARTQRTAGFILAATCLSLALAALLPAVAAVIVLTVAVVLLTLGESLQIAGAWELSRLHAPVSHRGAYLAVFSISNGVERAVGPSVVALFPLWGAVTWVPLAGAFALAGIAMCRLGEQPWPSRRQRRAPDPAPMQQAVVSRGPGPGSSGSGSA